MARSTTYIRSSSHTLKYTNLWKRVDIEILLKEYRRVTQLIVDDVWEWGLPYSQFNPQRNKLELPRHIDDRYIRRFPTWLTARVLQNIRDQVRAMLSAATEKRRKQLFMLKKLQREGEDTEYLQRRIDLQPLVKPNCSRIEATLNANCFDIEKQRKRDYFDLFIRLKCIGSPWRSGAKVDHCIPIKHTKVSKKWLKKGKQLKSIRLREDRIYLAFEMQKKKKKIRGRTEGCDQGILTVAFLSDGQSTKKDIHGHDLDSILEKFTRLKPGSRGFQRAKAHRLNYTNWALNQIKFTYVKEVRLEHLVNLRVGKKFKGKNRKKLLHWTYTLIKRKLQALSEVEGFVLTEVPNAFRSQRCSQCGWVRKANRKGKTFSCDRCGLTMDADENAAANLKLDLYRIPFWVRQRKINRTGFYWLEDGLFDAGHEPIVRDTQRALG